MPCEGLPHSEIPGSMPVCGSPRLIAACHVLHRFSAPRHPPSTLSSLTIKYLRRESFSFYLPDSLVKDRDHRGSKRTSVTEALFHPRCGLKSSTSLPCPPSPRLRRATSLARLPRAAQDGGAERTRTADLRLAKPPLSQLSYSPMEVGMPKWWA